jgi:hypothetical protein
MSAVPDNIVPFALPKKPRIKEKDAPPDQRKVAVLPIRAVFDKQMDMYKQQRDIGIPQGPARQ